MGGRLCTRVTDLAVLGAFVNHSDKAIVVLYAMASIARDKPTEKVDDGLYFGGWELLSRALGAKAFTPSAKATVGRAMRELVEAGLVEKVGRPGPKHRQVYRLTLPEPFVGTRQQPP